MIDIGMLLLGILIIGLLLGVFVRGKNRKFVKECSLL